MKNLTLLLFVIVASVFIFPLVGYAHTSNEETQITIASQWNFGLAVFFILIYVVYGLNMRKENEFVKKAVYFFFALITFYLALGSPLHLLGDEYLFSAHMLEQSLVYIAFPPLFLLSLPEEWVKPIVIMGLRIKILSFLKYPLIPLILFNVLFSFYHMPMIFNTVVSNEILHNLTHIILTITAIFMWVPLIPVVKELDCLSDIQKIGYIFAAGILLTPACALIIFSNESFYTVYENAPQIFAILPPLEDQKTGGIIMKVVQEIVYGTMIGYIFFHWAKKERLKDKNVTITGVVNG